MQERMSHTKKKKPEKFDTRFTRIEEKLNWLLENNGVPGGKQVISRLDESIVDHSVTRMSPQDTMMATQSMETLLSPTSSARHNSVMV